MQRFFFGALGILIAATAFGQIRNSSGVLVTPQLTGNASDVLKGDGTVGPGGGGESVPVGAILLIKSGTCPTGYAEDADLDGKTLIGTLAAHGDVGTTGGADSITPSAHAGTAVSAHAGTAVADHASHTHGYTEVPNHVHPYASQTATTGGVSSYEHGAIDASSTAAEASITTNNPTGGVATGTTQGPSATLTHSVTQPNNHTVTQPDTHAAMDNRSAFRFVIFCRKT